MTTFHIHLDRREIDGHEKGFNEAEIATLGYLLGMAVAGWNASVRKSGGTEAVLTETEP